MKNLNWTARIGWLISIALLIALLNGHYIFSPVIFGLSYYVVYVLSRFGNIDEKDDKDLLKERLFLVSIISLVLLWGSLNHQMDIRGFIRDFESTCNRMHYQENKDVLRLCDEIQTYIGDLKGINDNY